MKGSRESLADAAAIALLLLVAFAPVALGYARVQSQRLTAADRGRLIREIETRHALGRGVLPHWDPLQFGGAPLLSAAQSHVFYPPHLVARAFPLEWFPLLTVALHAWVAGIGAYFVARQIAMTRAASCAAAGAVMLGTVLAPGVDLSRSPGVLALAWVPLALAFAMRSTARPRMLPHAGLVITATMAVMTGSMRAMTYVLTAAAAWFIFAHLWPAGAAWPWRLALAQLALLVVLALGLSAVHTVPAARSFMLTRPMGIVADDPAPETAAHSKAQQDTSSFERVAATLAPVRTGRVISTCDAAANLALAARAIPMVGGDVGVAADYAQFVNLASGTFPESSSVYSGLPHADAAPTRTDLVKFLDAEYLVSCGTPDAQRWEAVSEAGAIGIYRSRDTFGRAVWTCAPRAVGRGELIYRLTRQRYDSLLTLRAGGPVVHIRWTAHADEPARLVAESRFHLARERFLGERTWEYELLDASSANIAAIVTSPLVEDTAGVDRARFTLIPATIPGFDREPKSEQLLGVEPCGDVRHADVLTSDRHDGRVVVAVDAPRDGLLFLSETYSPERRAWVDGAPVEPLRVNLAFTGIAITRGPHRVELRYDVRPFWAGAFVSALSLAIWTGAELRSRHAARLAEQVPLV